MRLLGVKIDNLNNRQILDKVREYLDSSGWHQLATVNPEFLVAAQHNNRFKNILNECDINIADGFGIKIGSILTGQTPPPRLAGVDLIWQIFELCEEKKCSVLLLGGQPKIGERAKVKILKKYPNLNIQTIAGGKIKYHAENKNWWQNSEILSKIKKLEPTVIMAALGHPKQELWLYDHQAKMPFVKVGIGIGGSLDFISGYIRRAPYVFRYLGLEWLWRLIQEPKRLKRISNATFKFIYYIFKYK